MRKRYVVPALIIVVVVGFGYDLWQKGFFALGGKNAKVYQIGILVRGASYLPGVEGFKQKMKELGYREGENATYTLRVLEKKEDLPAAVSELLAANVDLLHTYSTPATVEAHTQTKTVPIVFGSMGDPVASKTIRSLEHPGTNVTGIASLSVPLTAKRFEYLVEAIPSIQRVAFPYTPGDIPGESSYRVILDAAKKLHREVIPYAVTKERDVKTTAASISRREVDSIVISSDSAVWAALPFYVGQAIKEKLPFAVFDKDMVASGGLLGYGPDYFVSGEQSAVLVDKILRGQDPGNLPIEIPQRLILALNLKTAKAIGITFPESILRKADIVFEQ